MDTTVPARSGIVARTRAGLILAAVLGVADLFVSGLPGSSQTGDKPPTSVLVFGAFLGIVTLACLLVVRARWSPGAVRVAAASRALSALGALPGLFAGGVQPSLLAITATWVPLNLLAAGLLLAAPSRSHPS